MIHLPIYNLYILHAVLQGSDWATSSNIYYDEIKGCFHRRLVKCFLRNILYKKYRLLELSSPSWSRRYWQSKSTFLKYCFQLLLSYFIDTDPLWPFVTASAAVTAVLSALSFSRKKAPQEKVNEKRPLRRSLWIVARDREILSLLPLVRSKRGLTCQLPAPAPMIH